MCVCIIKTTELIACIITTVGCNFYSASVLLWEHGKKSSPFLLERFSIGQFSATSILEIVIRLTQYNSGDHVDPLVSHDSYKNMFLAGFVPRLYETYRIPLVISAIRVTFQTLLRDISNRSRTIIERTNYYDDQYWNDNRFATIGLEMLQLTGCM